jgi:hypothetical protein
MQIYDTDALKLTLGVVVEGSVYLQTVRVGDREIMALAAGSQ